MPSGPARQGRGGTFGSGPVGLVTSYGAVDGSARDAGHVCPRPATGPHRPRRLLSAGPIVALGHQPRAAIPAVGDLSARRRLHARARHHRRHRLPGPGRPADVRSRRHRRERSVHLHRPGRALGQPAVGRQHHLRCCLRRQWLGRAAPVARCAHRAHLRARLRRLPSERHQPGHRLAGDAGQLRGGGHQPGATVADLRRALFRGAHGDPRLAAQAPAAAVAPAAAHDRLGQHPRLLLHRLGRHRLGLPRGSGRSVAPRRDHPERGRAERAGHARPSLGPGHVGLRRGALQQPAHRQARHRVAGAHAADAHRDLLLRLGGARAGVAALSAAASSRGCSCCGWPGWPCSA